MKELFDFPFLCTIIAECLE